jgi:hypothetical protein
MPIEALLQNYFRRSLRLMEGSTEQCVASDVNCSERVTFQYNDVINKALF